MQRGSSIVVVVVLLGWVGPASAQVETLQTKAGVEIKVEDVVGGLVHPWGMAFLPDGRLLVTERNTGELHILARDGALSEPLEGVPKVWSKGQGGLMDVALSPTFKQDRLVYLSYAKPGPGEQAATALGRGKLTDDGIEGFQEIFVQSPMVTGANHFGNRIVFSRDGEFLYLALGERFKFEPAQDLSNTLGTVIRIHPDGRVPKDNPFVGRKDAEPEIWTYGHRNIEAMALQPGTDALWVVEMGPLGGDELNLIQRGKNYGWPKVSWGDHYDGREIPDPAPSSEFADAKRHWSPVISPSGMMFYGGDMFREWRGNAFVGSLSSYALIRLEFKGTELTAEERLPLPARIRDVEEGPDGAIYVLIDRIDGHVWRLVNMERPKRKAAAR